MDQKQQISKLLDSMREIILQLQEMHKKNFPEPNPSKYIKTSLVKSRMLVDKLIVLLDHYHDNYLFQSENYHKKLHHHNGLLNYGRSLLNGYFFLDKQTRQSEFLKFKIKMFELDNSFNASFDDLFSVPIAQQPVLKSKKTHIRSRTMGDFSYSIMNLSQDRKYTFMPSDSGKRPSKIEKGISKSSDQVQIIMNEANDKRSSLPALTTSLSLTQTTSPDTNSEGSIASNESSSEKYSFFQYKMQQLENDMCKQDSVRIMDLNQDSDSIGRNPTYGEEVEIFLSEEDSLNLNPRRESDMVPDILTFYE